MRASRETRIGVIVVVCAAIGAAIGFGYGASISIPGAMLEGEVLSGGNRRIFFTGLVNAGPGLIIGAVVGGIVGLLVRAWRHTRTGSEERT